MGGFAMTHRYGSPRQTHDLDVCDFAPSTQSAELLALAQEGSALHRHFGVYIQRVTVAPVRCEVTVPCDHLERLNTLATPTFENLTLQVLDSHDLALSKLERSQDPDLSDIQHLAA